MRRKLIRKFRKWKQERLPEILLPWKVRRIRRKEQIRVLFVLNTLSMWKSEALYREMLDHPRFQPILFVCPTWEVDDTDNIVRYLTSKGYEYKLIKEGYENIDLQTEFRPDVIFYQKPYEGAVSPNLAWSKNRDSLICYVNYGFHGVDEDWSRNTPMLNSAWQIYHENQLTAEASAALMENGGKNLVVTGLPIQDDLAGVGAEDTSDPWRPTDGNKKRIIWAPHHSIDPENWLQLATFTEYAFYMLAMASKYSDKVQWAFKPHPLLKPKLDKYWGKEKADEYYAKWADMSNSQIETGRYAGLFRHSDAMIHDCGSFTVEYIYSGKPAMYLIRDKEQVEKGLNEFQKGALHLHYPGYNQSDIETFIQNIINEVDPLNGQREDFISTYLTPPGGQTASTNILHAILGKN